MRKILIGFVVIVSICILAILILPALIPSSVYKDKIQQQISTSLGRDVNINGDVKLSVFPTLKATAQSVEIANAQGFGDTPFATMESLQAKVKLFPLFKEQVEITEFTLVNPKITLSKTKDGDVNWAFGPQGKTTVKSDAGFARDGRYTDLQISLGTFALKNGTIDYQDAQAGKTFTLRDANLTMTMLGMDKPITAKGNLVFNDTPMDIDTRLDSPSAFLNAQAAPFYVHLKSDLITLSADGKFTPTQDITFDINFDADIPSVSNLDTVFGIENPYGALSETANFKAALSFDGTTLVAKNANMAFNSDIMSTSFTGDFTAGAAPTASGDLDLAIKDLQKLQDTLGMAIPQLKGLSTVDLTTALTTNGKTTTGQNIKLDVKGPSLTAQYTGAAKFDTALSLTGDFTANSPSVTSLLASLGLQAIPVTNALGDFNIAGTVTGPVDALEIKGLNLTTAGENLTASYSGDVILGDTATLNGSFAAKSPAVKTFASTAGITLPYANALGALDTKGNISGALTALSLTDLNLALSEGLLNVNFTGNANTGKTTQYNGHLSTQISSIRELAAMGGTVLAVSTEQGEIYGLFSLEGQATGTATDIRFDNATLKLDDIVGVGKFTADLRATKPLLGGELSLEGLDLRPYMVAQNPTGEIQPWSEAPLNLAALKLFNANFKLNTPNILVGRMNIGQSNIQTTVKNGVLTSNIPNVSLYGGQGNLDMAVDANATIPTIALDFTLNNMDGKGFLGAAAGFTKLTGNTGTTMRFRGAGRSQAEIMKSLNGGGNFELAEGVISGVDIGQFVGGLETAFTQRALPPGLGNQYTTPFKKLAGLFSVKLGIVTIGDFDLSANNVLAEGAGTLDLGQQKIDFSFRPRLKEGTGLAAFGIPIRFKGDFGGVSASLDTELLTKIAAARAKAQLQKEISKKVGGDVGAVLGGLLGGGQIEQTNPEDAIGGLLDGLLGTKAPEEDEAKPAEDDKKDEDKEEEEDPLDKALKSLFGGGN